MPRLACLLLAILCLIGTVAMAHDTQPQPPAQYRLEDVTILAVRHVAGPAVSSEQATLPGKGQATLERGTQRMRFQCPAKELQDLLSGFYRVNFFDHPEDMLAQYSVVQRADGTVISGVLHLMDAPSTKLCLTLGGYRKCVTFGPHGPEELAELARRIFATAERLARTGPPKNKE